MPEGVGLALSGGGFRATLFHLGSLLRLNELGLLSRINRFSSVSGGSIASAYLGLKWANLEWSAPAGQLSPVANNLREQVIEPLFKFCQQTVDTPAILIGLLPFVRAGDLVEKAYDKQLFGGATLQSLPAYPGPEFIVNATNLQTGSAFRFGREYTADYKLGLIMNPDFRLASAVAASSAFPPFLSPYKLRIHPRQFEPADGAYLNPFEPYTKEVLLTDGGVYDNHGLEPLWGNVKTILISDAGAPFQTRPDASWDAPVPIPLPGDVKRLMRTFDVTDTQNRYVRRRWLIDRFKLDAKPYRLAEPDAVNGSYWSITSETVNYDFADSMDYDSVLVSELTRVGTRLAPFDKTIMHRLVNWGYAISDTALRRWVACPNHAVPQWPFPQYPLQRAR